ncbi:MAG: type II secretion system F family protein [Candidatus Buchananbacteria bacterium]|jgi:type IV pilus assembly protein PilC
MDKLNNWFINLQSVPVTAKIFLLQNLAVMIKAGLPLADALATLAKQSKNLKLNHILMDVQQKISTGKSFSEALLAYSKDFGEVFVSMIAAGEASGSLEEVLNSLYIQLKKDHSLKSKIRNAMTYPVIIIGAMFGIGTFVIIYVLPNITAMFSEMKADLPLPTLVLISISDYIQANGIIVFPSVILAIIIFFRWTRSKSGRIIWHNILLRAPVVGEIIKKINIARLSLSLSNLIQTDIAIPEALRITSSVVGNSVYKKALLEASEKVKKGKKIAEIFQEYPNILPPIIIQMVAVGEETGALDVVLKNLADFYQEEVEQTMENLPIIIEPLLMILMGVAVAGLAIAVILPIYSLTSKI